MAKTVYLVEGEEIGTIEEAREIAKLLAKELSKPIKIYRAEQIEEIREEIQEGKKSYKLEKETVESIRSQIEMVLDKTGIYEICEQTVNQAIEQLKKEGKFDL
jgi:ABC-type proline/glycine betaine transport system substrate-binding protein